MADKYIRLADAIDMCGGYGDLAYMMSKIKPADVVQVVHGHWVKTADGAECDNCGREAVYQIIDGRWQYEPWCPHCGARMDAQGEE